MRVGRPLSRRERTFAWITVVVAFCGLSYVYIFEPVALQWTAVRQEVEELERERAELHALLINREEIETAFETHLRGIATDDTSQSPELKLISDVERLAAQNGLEVMGIKPLRARSVRGLDRLAVQLEARTTNHQLIDFLLALQKPTSQVLCEDLVVNVGRERPPLSITTTLSRLVRRSPAV